MRRSIQFIFLTVALLVVSGGWMGAQAYAATAAPEMVSPTNGQADVSSRMAVTAERGEAIARAYLAENAATYGVQRADFTDLRVIKNYADATTGARYVKFLQTVNGIEIYNAAVNVTILPSGDVVYVGNRAVASLLSNANSATPSITRNAAIAAAADDVGLRYSPASLTVAESLGGAEQAATSRWNPSL